MELFYIMLGILLAISIKYLWNRYQAGISKLALVVGSVAVGLCAFALAFIAASLGEGEPQAAGMAAMIFGGIAILLVIWFKKLTDKTSVTSNGNNVVKQ